MISTRYESLIVCDGATVPSSLGVNPLWTISAIAERAMAYLMEDKGWSSSAATATATAATAAAAAATDGGVSGRASSSTPFGVAFTAGHGSAPFGDGAGAGADAVKATMPEW